MNLKSYLLPKNFNVNKENPLGIILGFKKLLNSANTKDKMAVLLYFDFCTGRVERYLVNTSNKNDDKIRSSLNNDIFYFNRNKYYINYSDEHLRSQEKELFSFNQNLMIEGKLSTKFYELFI
jgi:hypothetical protein